MTAKSSRKASATRKKQGGSGRGILRAIAVMKLAKALILVGVGLGALKLLDAAAADRMYRWASVVAWRVGPKTGATVQQKLSTLHPSQLVLVAVVSLAYAALFIVEGVGLWIGKRWAEFLTIIAISSFAPFEVYELIRQVKWERGATLAVNLAIVGYLIWKVRQPR